LLEKPFNHAALIRETDRLHHESKWYSDNVEKIGVIMGAVTADPSDGLRQLKRLVNDSPNPVPVLLLGARKLRENEFLEEAIDLLKSVLEIDRGSVPAISELGRCLHMLGRYDEAMQFLRRADSMSPANVDRLSLMGEVELNRTDPSSARDLFSEALKIDQENRRARRGLRVAGTLSEMMHRPAGVHIKDTFASLMNTVAVNLAHSGEFSSAIEKYEEAFHFIAGRDTSAKVAFNVGLAYLRWGKIRESYDWFAESAKRGHGKFTKAEEYVEKLALKLRQAEEEKHKARIAAEAAAAEESAKKAEAEKESTPESEKSDPAPEHEQPN
jgi:tetratricopeptide (TPR) repeat protein